MSKLKIIKEKTVNMTIEEIMIAVKEDHVPAGVTIDITGDLETISVSPEGKVNLFGEVNEDYELIYSEED